MSKPSGFKFHSIGMTYFDRRDGVENYPKLTILRESSGKIIDISLTQKQLAQIIEQAAMTLNRSLPTDTTSKEN